MTYTEYTAKLAADLQFAADSRFDDLYPEFMGDRSMVALLEKDYVEMSRITHMLREQLPQVVIVAEAYKLDTAVRDDFPKRFWDECWHCSVTLLETEDGEVLCPKCDRKLTEAYSF